MYIYIPVYIYIVLYTVYVHICCSFTTADCVLGFTLWWASTIEQGRLLDSYPVLRTYLNTLRSRRAFRKTLGQKDLDFGIGHYFITCIKDSLQD